MRANQTNIHQIGAIQPHKAGPPGGGTSGRGDRRVLAGSGTAVTHHAYRRSNIQRIRCGLLHPPISHTLIGICDSPRAPLCLHGEVGGQSHFGAGVSCAAALPCARVVREACVEAISVGQRDRLLATPRGGPLRHQCQPPAVNLRAPCPHPPPNPLVLFGPQEPPNSWGRASTAPRPPGQVETGGRSPPRGGGGWKGGSSVRGLDFGRLLA